MNRGKAIHGPREYASSLLASLLRKRGPECSSSACEFRYLILRHLRTLQIHTSEGDPGASTTGLLCDAVHDLRQAWCAWIVQDDGFWWHQGAAPDTIILRFRSFVSERRIQVI